MLVLLSRSALSVENRSHTRRRVCQWCAGNVRLRSQSSNQLWTQKWSQEFKVHLRIASSLVDFDILMLGFLVLILQINIVSSCLIMSHHLAWLVPPRNSSSSDSRKGWQASLIAFRIICVTCVACVTIIH